MITNNISVCRWNTVLPGCLINVSSQTIPSLRQDISCILIDIYILPSVPFDVHRATPDAAIGTRFVASSSFHPPSLATFTKSVRAAHIQKRTLSPDIVTYVTSEKTVVVVEVHLRSDFPHITSTFLLLSLQSFFSSTSYAVPPSPCHLPTLQKKTGPN